MKQWNCESIEILNGEWKMREAEVKTIAERLVRNLIDAPLFGLLLLKEKDRG